MEVPHDAASKHVVASWLMTRLVVADGDVLTFGRDTDISAFPITLAAALFNHILSNLGAASPARFLTASIPFASSFIQAVRATPLA